MHSRPLVSAIIIFLNGEKYIEEAVVSIFAQTCDSWELLFVDDGSSDASTEIARRYAGHYPDRVCYLEHEGHQNRGMSASRNLGIAHARGEYIAFLDADDTWLPNKLAEQIAIFEAYPEAGMVYGRTLIWHSWTGNPEDRTLDHTYDLGVPPNTLVRPPLLFYLLLENKDQTPTTCNAIMRHEVVNAVGGFEESFPGLYEDCVFFAKIHLRAPVYVADACWARYRQHAENCCSNMVDMATYYALRRPFLEWLTAYIDKQGISKNSSISRALQKELWAAQHPYISRVLHPLHDLARRAKRQWTHGAAR